MLPIFKHYRFEDSSACRDNIERLRDYLQKQEAEGRAIYIDEGDRPESGLVTTSFVYAYGGTLLRACRYDKPNDNTMSLYPFSGNLDARKSVFGELEGIILSHTYLVGKNGLLGLRPEDIDRVPHIHLGNGSE